jgi:hypothetical protein
MVQSKPAGTRATAPKPPTDRLSKVVKPKVETVEGGRKVTLRGFDVTVPDEAIDDFELVEELGRIQFGEQSEQGRLPSILRRLVGDDGYKTVMDGLRAANGRVPVKDGFEYIQELLGALNPNS